MLLMIFFSSIQSDDSDIWDDTALIKAYDKAVASFKVIRMTPKTRDWEPHAFVSPVTMKLFLVLSFLTRAH